ncbi:36764_t:CDS:1, partial [Gigaspora margarita]
YQVTIKKVIREIKQSEIDDYPGHLKQMIMKFYGINDYKPFNNDYKRTFN